MLRFGNPDSVRIHEAGHAVMARLLKIRVMSVGAMFYEGELIDAGVEFDNHFDNERSLLRRQMLAGGEAAEIACLGAGSGGGVGDAAKCRRLGSGLFPVKSALIRLRKHKATLFAIANALEKRELLLEDELETIFRKGGI